jgi:hypothetical protein
MYRIILILNSTVKLSKWKLKPGVRPYYRLIAITGPGLNVSNKKGS